MSVFQIAAYRPHAERFIFIRARPARLLPAPKSMLHQSLNASSVRRPESTERMDFVSVVIAASACIVKRTSRVFRPSRTGLGPLCWPFSDHIHTADRASVSLSLRRSGQSTAHEFVSGYREPCFNFVLLSPCLWSIAVCAPRCGYRSAIAPPVCTMSLFFHFLRDSQQPSFVVRGLGRDPRISLGSFASWVLYCLVLFVFCCPRRRSELVSCTSSRPILHPIV